VERLEHELQHHADVQGCEVVSDEARLDENFAAEVDADTGDERARLGTASYKAWIV
jgi:hypothetical protein